MSKKQNGSVSNEHEELGKQVCSALSEALDRPVTVEEAGVLVDQLIDTNRNLITKVGQLQSALKDIVNAM